MKPDGFSISLHDLNETNRLLDPVWEFYRGSHILVTGGTGFIGLWLVECLLWANIRRSLGMKVTVLSRDPGRFISAKAPHLAAHSNLRILGGRVEDFAPSGLRFTNIIHAASESKALGESGDWSSRHLIAALEGTKNVLRIGAEHGIESMLLTSSGSVYLPSTDCQADDRFVEGQTGVEDFASEKYLYGQTKRMMEILTAITAKNAGFRAPIARCFAFVGPHLPLNANYAIGNFVKDVLDERQIVVSGDGTPLRSYLYASDLVVWLLTILAKGKSGRPYNVGGSEVYSIRDVAYLVDSCANKPQGVLIQKQPSVGAKPSAYLPDVSRSNQELGLREYVSLRDAIQRTISWHTLR